MEKPVHRLTKICIHEKRDHQSYQQICTELHYTSGGRRERRGTGGGGGWGKTIKRGQVTGKFTTHTVKVTSSDLGGEKECRE